MMLRLLFSATIHFVWIVRSTDAQGGRIVGGEDAADGVFDFLGTPDPLVCAGTLVHPQILLTAAHCECGFVDVDVLLGTNNAGDRQDAIDVVSVSDQRIVHPSYSSTTSNADMMLVKLSRPADGVPVATIATDVPADGSDVKAIGFGALSEGGRLSDTLQVVTVPIVGSSTCTNSNYYGDLVNGVTMVCAGVEGKDSCQGDSGGPLLNDSNQLVGITSFGIGICTLLDDDDLPSFCNGVRRDNLELSDSTCRSVVELAKGYLP